MNLEATRLRRAVSAAVLSTVLAACGGGGGGDAAVAPAATPSTPTPPPAPAAVPAPVTQTMGSDGGDIVVPLVEEAQLTLRLPAQALDGPTPVTVEPRLPAAGEWTRFDLRPAPGALRGTLTLIVQPPPALEPRQLPLLQLLTDEGPLPLRTRVLAGGGIEATLPAQVAQLDAAPRPAAVTGRMQALSASRRLADGPAASDGTATVVGARFLATCEAAPAVLADAMRVIQNASSARAVHTALTTLALVADRCVQPGVLDEAGLLRVNQALQDLARQLPDLYAQALAAWKAIDHGWIEVQFDPFRRGVRRLLALCAAAREVGASLDCPRVEDYEPEFIELSDGFAAAANEQQHQAGLRLLFDQLLPLPAEAALMGLPAAEASLRGAVAQVADRLMDRAYALCSHGELFEWRAYVEQGGYSRRSAQTLARAIAHCGVQGVAERVAVDDQGRETRSQPQAFEPGTLDGAGRTEARTLVLPFDGHAVIGFGGPSLRCSRVVGAPEQRETLQLRVGERVVGQVALASVRDAEGAPRSEAALDLRALRQQIGRAADGAEPIELAVWRTAAGPLACSDSAGGTLELRTDEARLFTLMLEPPTAGLRLRIGAPPAIAQRASVMVEVRARQPDGSLRPLADAPVTLQITGAERVGTTALSTGSNGTVGFVLRPLAGHGEIALAVRAERDGQSAEAQVRIPIGRVLWTGRLHAYNLRLEKSLTQFDPDAVDSSDYVLEDEIIVPETTFVVEGNPWEEDLQLPRSMFPRTQYRYSFDHRQQVLAAWTQECRVRLTHQTARDFEPHPDGSPLAQPVLRLATGSATVAQRLDGQVGWRVDMGGMRGTAVVAEVWTHRRSPQAGSHCTSESHQAPPSVRTYDGPERRDLFEMGSQYRKPALAWRVDLPAQPATDEIVIDIDEQPVMYEDNGRLIITDRFLRLRMRPQLP
ncbi:MAG: hypothetical protein KF683_05985 [Rubrivivax sp.]|nr:hypothetical protein [Rubrivivax sp.]